MTLSSFSLLYLNAVTIYLFSSLVVDLNLVGLVFKTHVIFSVAK